MQVFIVALAAVMDYHLAIWYIIVFTGKCSFSVLILVVLLNLLMGLLRNDSDCFDQS